MGVHLRQALQAVHRHQGRRPPPGGAAEGGSAGRLRHEDAARERRQARRYLAPRQGRAGQGRVLLGVPGGRARAQAGGGGAGGGRAEGEPTARALMRRARGTLLIWAFLAPSLAIFLLYRILPLLWNVGLSLHTWSPFRPRAFAGLVHY